MLEDWAVEHNAKCSFRISGTVSINAGPDRILKRHGCIRGIVLHNLAYFSIDQRKLREFDGRRRKRRVLTRTPQSLSARVGNGARLG